jgi:hypothetical protein
MKILNLADMEEKSNEQECCPICSKKYRHNYIVAFAEV